MFMGVKLLNIGNQSISFSRSADKHNRGQEVKVIRTTGHNLTESNKYIYRPITVFT